MGENLDQVNVQIFIYYVYKIALITNILEPWYAHVHVRVKGKKC